MSNSSEVSAGDDILASQYNNLRADVIDTATGHNHDGVNSKSPQFKAVGIDADYVVLQDDVSIHCDTQFNNIVLTLPTPFLWHPKFFIICNSGTGGFNVTFSSPVGYPLKGATTIQSQQIGLLVSMNNYYTGASWFLGIMN